jgi:hypothetical protein
VGVIFVKGKPKVCYLPRKNSWGVLVAGNDPINNDIFQFFSFYYQRILEGFRKVILPEKIVSLSYVCRHAYLDIF